MTIHRAIPADLAPRDGSTIGSIASGVDVSPFQTGPTTSRRWQSLFLRRYSWTLALFSSTSDYLEQWERFLWLIGGNHGHVWIIEPLSGRHNGVQCGGLADGSQTTFPLPIQSATNTAIYVDDVLQASSGYTIHSAANTLSADSIADMAGANVFTTTSCTVDVHIDEIFAHGLDCFSVTPDAASTCSIHYPLVGGVAASVGQEYTASIAARGPHQIKIKLQWLDSGSSPLSTDSSTGSSLSETTWIQESITATAPASTAYVAIIIEITSPATTDPIYIDCMSLGPGDNTDWWLPSQAPALIEFASAPSANARVTAHGTGYRMARCRLSKATQAWSIMSQGHAQLQRWTAQEEVWK